MPDQEPENEEQGLLTHWAKDNDRLFGLLFLCNVPEQRREDLRWLRDNLLINNKSQAAKEAHRIIQNRLRWESLRNGSER